MTPEEKAEALFEKLEPEGCYHNWEFCYDTILWKCYCGSFQNPKFEGLGTNSTDVPNTCNPNLINPGNDDFCWMMERMKENFNIDFLFFMDEWVCTIMNHMNQEKGECAESGTTPPLALLNALFNYYKIGG